MTLKKITTKLKTNLNNNKFIYNILTIVTILNVKVTPISDFFFTLIIFKVFTKMTILLFIMNIKI